MNIMLGKLFVPYATSSDILVMSPTSIGRISSEQYLELYFLDKKLNKCTM